MPEGILRYDRMVENALKGVLREALAYVSEKGLPGQHHFYITFRTRHPGVDIPDYLVARYPDDITIVLQHQFWGLEVSDAGFGVTLSFNGVNERLYVPFDAVSAFADPSAKFGLQFNVEPAGDEEAAEAEEAEAGTEETAAAEAGAGGDAASSEPADSESDEDPADGAKVITLDAFRKK